MTDQPFRAGFLLFPKLTQLDMTGPYEVLARLPGAQVHLIWKTREPVPSDHGMAIVPTATFDACPALDLICVPGGPGVGPLMSDGAVLAFLRRAAEEARYVTSVCTGSLVLGAAGLLRGRKAACHWMSRPLLSSFGAEPTDERVVWDGTLVTGGGVTAGIDFALQIAAEVAGADTARAIQLGIEYDPAPPFDAGSPEGAGPALVEAITRRAATRQRERADQVAEAAAALRAAE